MLHKWTIGFDADDTLWHNETFFQDSQARFANMLVDYADPHDLKARMIEAEKRNLQHYGYGIKGFTLSMIETAIEVSSATVPAETILALLDMGRDMLSHPIDLLPHSEQIIKLLSRDANLVLITKGDLLDQERKLAQSGLGEYFDDIQIVSEKTPDVYQHIFSKYDTPRCMMVGNSMKSDILPALEVGAWAAHVPYEITWELEHAPKPDHPRFSELESLADLPELIARLDG